jgi:transcription elongation factor S-II
MYFSTLDVAQEDIIRIACEIEQCLFKEFGNPADQKYKAKFRSKYLNLKDKSNPTLREALLTKVLSPEKFCAMTPAVY